MRFLQRKRAELYIIGLGIMLLELVSCATPTNVAYFQDAEALNGMWMQA